MDTVVRLHLGEETPFLHIQPSHANDQPFANEKPVPCSSFIFFFFKNLSIGSAPRLEPETFRSPK